jgi:hypothetical protein
MNRDQAINRLWLSYGVDVATATSALNTAQRLGSETLVIDRRDTFSHGPIEGWRVRIDAAGEWFAITEEVHEVKP